MGYKTALLICFGIVMGILFSNLLEEYFSSEHLDKKETKEKHIAPGGFEVSKDVYCI